MNAHWAPAPQGHAALPWLHLLNPDVPLQAEAALISTNFDCCRCSPIAKWWAWELHSYGGWGRTLCQAAAGGGTLRCRCHGVPLRESTRVGGVGEAGLESGAAELCDCLRLPRQLAAPYGTHGWPVTAFCRHTFFGCRRRGKGEELPWPPQKLQQACNDSIYGVHESPHVFQCTCGIITYVTYGSTPNVTYGHL